MANSSSDELRSPSQAQQQPQPQRQASQSHRRRRSSSRRSPSVASDAGTEETIPNSDQRRKPKNKRRQQNRLPAVNEVESTRQQVAQTAENAAATDQSGGGRSDDTLRLRLDLNLDVDIRLTAKVHGDLTLALLSF